MIKKLFFMILGSLLILSACSNNDEKDKDTNDQKSESHMKHNDESKVPEDMKSTNEGEFKVGDKVTITAGHMPGMKGAEATVKGAYKTYAYVVSYKHTNVNKKVNNQKYILKEEIKDARNDGCSYGDTVRLDASHLSGMKGATSSIYRVKWTTVYVVDYKS